MIFESLQINKITYLVEENDLVLAFVLTEANIDKRIVTSQIIIKIIIKVSFYANNLFETRAAVQGESRNNNIFFASLANFIKTNIRQNAQFTEPTLLD